MGAFVLIVMLWGDGGWQIAMQDFTSRERCEQARTIIDRMGPEFPDEALDVLLGPKLQSECVSK